MEYFVWYGIYLILKELGILPEHVPRGTIAKEFAIPTHARKSRSIHFCPCDTGNYRNTMDMFHTREYGINKHNGFAYWVITVYLTCSYCGNNAVLSKKYSVNDNYALDSLLELTRKIMESKVRKEKGK